MVVYNKVPGMDSGNNLMPEVLQTIADSTQINTKINNVALTYLGVLASGTDLNTLYSTSQSGYYILSSGSTYVNGPAALNGTGVLQVIRGGSSTLAVVHRVTSGIIDTWREATDAGAGTWSAWMQVETTAGSDAKIAALGPAWAPTRSVPSNGDLNTYRTPGVSRIRTPDTATIQNLPPGMRSSGNLINETTGDGTDSIFGQRVIESGSNPRVLWRSLTDSVLGTWSPWVQLGGGARPVTEWHIVLAIGQSNMSGRGIVGTSDGGKYVSSRIAQYGATRRVLETATVPLDMHDTASGLSPATVFARNYLRNQPEHVGVIIVPAAHGSTGFTTSTGTYTWSPGIATNPAFDLPNLAVVQVQEAIAAALATGAVAEFKAIVFHQGENNSAMSTTSYANNLDALITYLRTRIGSANLPFIVGQMSPEGIAANAGRPNIDAAHQQTPSRVAYTGFAPATMGGYNPGDTTHLSQVGVDYIGRTYLEAYNRALFNTDLSAEAVQNGRLSALESAAGFGSPPLALQDSAVKSLLVDTASLSNVELVNQAATTGKPLNTAMKAIASAAADGVTYAKLGVIPASSLPPLVINDTFPVASQAEMLALTAQRGDVAIRSDVTKSYILSTDSPSTLADWKELLSNGKVLSVAGQTGVVVLTKSDVGLSNVDNTSDINKPVSNAQSTALGLKEDKANKGAASGYAPLDSGSRVPVANLPTTLPTLLANNAKLDTDAVSTWPLGVSYMSTTSNGFGVNFGTVVTVRTGISSRSTQTVIQSSAGLHLERAETAGDVWGPWYTVALDTLATSSAKGLMSGADKAKLDSANSVATPGGLVQYSAGGGLFAVATPTSGTHPTTKTYVDNAIAALPQGAITNGYNTSSTVTAALNTVETMVLECSSVAIKAGRNYRLTVMLDIQSTTAASVGVRVELSYGGTAGNPNGNLLKGATQWSAPAAAAVSNDQVLVAKYTPAADTTTRFNVSVIRNSGAADFKIGERMLLIEDMGTAVLP